MKHITLRAYEYEKVLEQLKEVEPTTNMVMWEALFNQLWKDFDRLMKQKATFIINSNTEKDLLDIDPKQAEKIIKQKKRLEHELHILNTTKEAVQELKSTYLDTSTRILETYHLVKKLFAYEYDEARKNASTCYTLLINEYQNTAFWMEQYEKQLNENQKLRQQIQNLNR